MNKKRILFVCLGNICRSPAAEAVMNKIIEKNKLQHLIEVDSAGTIDYHSGEPADSRMKEHAKKRGYEIKSIARQFNNSVDFQHFDYIVTMDDENVEDVKALDYYEKYQDKIFKMVDFSKKFEITEVPDPYYSGKVGFEQVLDILEDSAMGLLNKVQNDLKQ
jgi:protein-tyrosine phosphatase